MPNKENFSVVGMTISTNILHLKKIDTRVPKNIKILPQFSR